MTHGGCGEIKHNRRKGGKGRLKKKGEEKRKGEKKKKGGRARGK